ncbi:MAG: proline--tRNA ligase [Candidatus Krumholzibacteria bacterium]|nr:proline--tRNA ligase [Candidatus Krumholzibacteria bacterium]
MRWSKSCIPTFKENPAEAEIPSHRLMLRAGLIRKLTSGVYTFLPLGFKVIKKIEGIVREEMDAIGCQEVLMPVLHPIEIYEESGRLGSFGPELFKLQDGRQRTFALGPTHEEVITMIARDDMKSYRTLPQCLYQILIKFRDEIRPRYGVVRAREFIMKDAYSFHQSAESLDETYRAMEGAYRRIIERCGLSYRIVEADSGYIGGDESHEFVVLAGSGESTILSCSCGYAVNIERAAGRELETPRGARSAGAFERVHTPGMTTVEQVSGFLSVTPREVVKTLLYRAGDRDVAILIPGDRELNDIKLVRMFDGEQVRFLDDGEIKRLTGGPVGFSGPVGLSAETAVYADNLVKGYDSMIVGANEADTHLRGVKAGRDFTIAKFEDLVWAREGDLCPKCGAPLTKSNGLEVGHIFKLGTKYSRAMNAEFLDEAGKSHPFIMGCYGFGISRMVAAAIEQLHDKDGIVWPQSIAPMPLIVLPVNSNDAEIRDTAYRLEEEFERCGIETLLDDRDLSPGIKFKDADLVGIPYRLTIGKKLKDGMVELLHRSSRRVEEIPVAEAVERTMERIKT